MKTIIFSLLASFLLSSVSFGQTKPIASGKENTIAQLQTELVSPWLVTVAGEDRTRTLRITAASQQSDGTLLLEAVYGWSDTEQSAIQASASKSGQKNTLQFVTQASSKIVATETSNGIFEGTFTLKNGTTKAIRIEKISEDALQRKVSHALGATLVVKPAPAGTQSPQAERPELKTGDSWEYSFRDTRYAKPGCNYSLTVENITNYRIRAKVEHAENCEVGVTGTMAVRSGSVQEYDKDFNHFYYSKTPYRAFHFPLEVGKTWLQEYQYTIGPWRYRSEIKGTVVAVEKVTVPAGTFDTFKIALNRKYLGSAPGRETQSGTIEDTFWYSPVAKNFVKRTYSDFGSGTSSSPIVRELQKYNLQ